MAPTRVYGKRSRAIYDPFAVLASPQQERQHVASSEQIIKVDGEACSRTALRVKKTVTSGAPRNVLEEVDANIVAQPILHAASGKEKRRQPRARKKLERSSEETKLVNIGSPTPVDDGETLKLEEEVVCHDDRQENSLIPDVLIERPPCLLINDIPSVDRTGQELRAPDVTINVHRSIDQEDARKARNARSASLQPRALPTSARCSDHFTDPLLELSAHSLTPFSEWSDQLSDHFSIVKIAEASFGEVYRLSLLEDMSGFSSSDESVFKIIALQPPALESSYQSPDESGSAPKGFENMSSPTDVANEVKLLQRMSSIPGFTNFRDVRVVQGRPPGPFIRAYEAYNSEQQARGKEASIFPDPAEQASYSQNQLWAVIEMQDAGLDLERFLETPSSQSPTYQSTSIFTVWDIFWQVVLSLAKGEEGAQFEHRDLHLGNICVRLPASPTQKPEPLNPALKLNFTPLETTIIDYTLSRAQMSHTSTVSTDLSRSSHASLFESDSAANYQYEIYRYMRGALLHDDPYAKIDKSGENVDGTRSWQSYHPTTNLIWLHYILYTLLSQMVYPSTLKPPPRKQKGEFALHKRSTELERVLLRVQDLLDPGVVCKGLLSSAGDLVGVALGEGWLDVGDVVGRYGGVEETEGEEQELLESGEQGSLEVELIDAVRAMALDEGTDRREKGEDVEGVPRARRKRTGRGR